METLVNDSIDYFDVVICGAGLAGLTLALQIKKEVPTASIAIVEGTGDKSTTQALNVGESTIEASKFYLAEVLGLQEYLEAEHFSKWGLHLYFGHGHNNFQDRPELGTSIRSHFEPFQIDRAKLEKDLKHLIVGMGVQLLPDCKVIDIHLAKDNQLHRVIVSDSTKLGIPCRWVIDATGRRRFLQKRLGLAMPPSSNHSAAWFRIRGRIDISDMVPPDEIEWHNRVPGKRRYFATNHIMGAGRWVWLIPLASQRTSIGIVANEDFHPFEEYNSYERALRWLEKHEPAVRALIGDRQPDDFQCLRHYSYSAEQVFSIERWACTGDAAAFADPFFSPGIDQIAFANTFITDMIKREQAGTLQAETVNRYNEAFLSFHNSVTWLTHNGYPFYDDAFIMGSKMVWDIARGFFINTPLRINGVFLDEHLLEMLQPLSSKAFLLTLRMEKFFKAWAATTTKRHTYRFLDYLAIPDMNDLYMRNTRSKSSREILEDFQITLDFLEELVQILFLFALADTMPERLISLPSPLWLNAWGIGLNPQRWAADKLFLPSTKPRPLRIAQFADVFGVKDLPSWLLGEAT